jgi:MFS family permease
MPKILSNYIGSTAIIGFIMTIDNYFAIFIQPAVGTISDRINTRFGKRMPFIMIGMPLAFVFIILLANYTGLGTLILFLILTNLSMSIFRSPVISLMPDITHRSHRSKSNGIINFMGGIGAVIAYFIGSKLWDMNEKYPFYLAAALMLISFIVLFIYIKEKRDVIEYEKNDKKVGLFEGLRATGNTKNVLSLLLAICSWFIAYQGIEAFFTLYGENYLGLKTSAAAFSFTFISLSFLVFAIPAGLVGTKFGKKKTIRFGVIGLLFTFLFIAFLKNIWLIRGMFVVAGFFWSMININSYPFVTDMAPKGQIGVYTGLYYLFSSIAAIVSPPLLGLIIDLTGYKYMFFYGTIFLILALIFIQRININKDEIKL